MNTVLLIVVGVISLVVGSIIGTIKGLLTEEIRTRLRQGIYLLIRLAGSRVTRKVRNDLVDEWRAELDYIFRDFDGLPVTGLLRATSYSLGLLFAASAIERELTGTRRILHVRRWVLSFIGLLGVSLAIAFGGIIVLLVLATFLGYFISLRSHPFVDSPRGGRQERLGARLLFGGATSRYITGPVMQYSATEQGVSFTIASKGRESRHDDTGRCTRAALGTS